MVFIKSAEAKNGNTTLEKSNIYIIWKYFANKALNNPLSSF